MIGAVILAAGASRRLGEPKQLVPWRGVPLVRAVAAEACASTCDAVCVVLGAHGVEVAPALAGLPVTIEVNTAWREGIASSIRRGVAWARGAGASALVVLACDQPHLTAAHVDALVALHVRAGGAVASRYVGIAGIPAVFGADDFSALAVLRGDRGARAMLAARAVATIDWPEGAFDVDTPHDAAVARSVLSIRP